MRKIFFSVIAIFEALLIGGLLYDYFSSSMGEEKELIFLLHRFAWGNFLGLPPLLFLLFFISSFSGGKRN